MFLILDPFKDINGDQQKTYRPTFTDDSHVVFKAANIEGVIIVDLSKIPTVKEITERYEIKVTE
jgi:hypothetical protein